MAGFQIDEWVNADPQAVFNFAIDPQNAPKVVKEVQKMEKLSPGPFGKGTLLVETRLMNGKEHRTEIKIGAYNPPTSYTASAKQSGYTVTYKYTFKPENDGTRINLECVVSAAGLKNLASPMVAAAMKNEDGDHLKRLKAAILAEGKAG